MKVKFIPDLQKKKKKKKKQTSHESDTFLSGGKSSKINVSDVAVLMKKKQGRLQLFKLKGWQKTNKMPELARIVCVLYDLITLDELCSLSLLKQLFFCFVLNSE